MKIDIKCFKQLRNNTTKSLSFNLRLDYQQLVFCALATITNRRFELLKPTIIKPQELWTGKQVRNFCRILRLCKILAKLLEFLNTIKAHTLHVWHSKI